MKVRGLVGDPAGLPGGQVTGDDAFPEAGEAVAQLEGVADVAFAGLGGQADGGGVLGDGELRDQGGAGSGDGDGGVAEGAQVDGLGLLDGLRGVGDGPVHGGLEEVGLGLVGLPASVSGDGEDSSAGVVRQPGGPARGGHGSIPASTTDTPDPEMPESGENPLFHRGLQKLWCSNPVVVAVSPGRPRRVFVDGPGGRLLEPAMGLAALLNHWKNSTRNRSVAGEVGR